MIEAHQGVVLVPYLSAVVLVMIPGYRVGAVANVAASAATLAVGLWLVAAERIVDEYAIVDELNIVFIGINTLVGFTTSLFSASYIRHEIETGRLPESFVRLYHAMFQAMMGSMSLALVANNIGLMWVGLELATLITVVKLGAFATGGPFKMLFVGTIASGQHFFAFYSVMLSCLLVHYYFDHFIFLQRDKVITPTFGRLAPAA